jgi:hypothetical protein
MSSPARFGFISDALNRCGCSGYYTLEELLEAVEQFKREIKRKEREGDKEAA